MSFLSFGIKDIGIDLGTSHITVALKGKGIILKEPCAVAIDNRTEKIVATGKEAKEMIGKTPEAIKAIKPINNGVITNFTGTNLLLKNIFNKVSSKYNIRKPRVLAGIPVGITEVEQRALEEGILNARSKRGIFYRRTISCCNRFRNSY